MSRDFLHHYKWMAALVESETWNNIQWEDNQMYVKEKSHLSDV